MSDLFKLYADRVLALAADIPLTDPIDAPSHHATARAPLCGSNISVALRLKGDKIAAFSQSVHACALGQASAAIFAGQVIGRTAEEVQALREALADMLKGGPVPGAPFGDYEVLQAARDYPNRHASILLAPDATLKALRGTT
ncbi:iron-sulfur cluster assembly scaffold protein [Rhodobacter sp. TJ_12]|uniref:iron-sulfur cluster assembly scaffold protein n=1 Tax=Rhodobacter sp. TJ_12 TaxID=2029399 RepID=UPI001CBE39B9|nr:iron-sulfur cluster assembly scaffold protein [Rhodobacter sp. TJ_12]MBZ4022944.1 iron-sulfur cluster assembly scaffold protein [Rhodobacter sp. TJ_12]